MQRRFFLAGLLALGAAPAHVLASAQPTITAFSDLCFTVTKSWAPTVYVAECMRTGLKQESTKPFDVMGRTFQDFYRFVQLERAKS